MILILKNSKYKTKMKLFSINYTSIKLKKSSQEKENQVFRCHIVLNLKS